MPANPIRIIHVVAVEKEAFYFNNLIDHTDRNEFVHAFANFAGPCDFADGMVQRGLSVTNLGRLDKMRVPSAFLQLWRTLRALDPHIVHTHLFDPTYVGLLAA